jgi:O-antigen ligase
MFSISNFSLKYKNYFSLLLSLMPASFIAGNLIINLNILILVISALIIFKKEVFRIKYFLLDKFIFLFFLLILLTGIYNDYFFYSIDLVQLSWKGYFGTTIKSIFFLKYLFLFIILRFLVENKLIIFKYFFISCSICSLFVCFDIFFQFTFGQDIFGYQISPTRKLSGPFGDELIAGGFIQRFSIFSFFVLPIYYKSLSKLISKFFIPFLFIIFFLGIVLSGNRMPTILFIFTISLILIFNHQTRKFLFPFIIIFSLFFTIIFNLNSKVQNNFIGFYNQVSNIAIVALNKNSSTDNYPQYLREFESFYDTWLLNKYFGGGIKNFRYYCHVRPNIKTSSDFVCNMHPHNYYLEILTEIGLVGFVILIICFFLIICKTFYKKYFIKSVLNYNNVIIPFMFLFLTEIFPIKSTGSFFTTGNATYIFLIMAILIGLYNQDNLIEKKS